jgi:heptaprenyl diphosphate synthase
MACVPAFLLQNHLLFLGIQTVLVFVFALFQGKKIRILPPVILLVTITGLHLFSPIGKVLVSLGRISITSGALFFGLIKALTVIGLVYLSRGTVRSDVRIPGRFGAVIGRTFYYFNTITETWRRIPKQNIVERLDRLFSVLQPRGEGPTEENQTAGPADKPSGAKNAGDAVSGPGPAAQNGPAPGKTRPPVFHAGYISVVFFCTAQWVLFALQYLISWNPFTY